MICYVYIMRKLLQKDVHQFAIIHYDRIIELYEVLFDFHHLKYVSILLYIRIFDVLYTECYCDISIQWTLHFTLRNVWTEKKFFFQCFQSHSKIKKKKLQRIFLFSWKYFHNKHSCCDNIKNLKSDIQLIIPIIVSIGWKKKKLKDELLMIQYENEEYSSHYREYFPHISGKVRYVRLVRRLHSWQSVFIHLPLAVDSLTIHG